MKGQIVSETVLTNARIVLEDGVVSGTLCLRDGRIASVDSGLSALPAAQDCGGDYVSPGLIDLHTDALESHFVPRPKVVWPDHRAAALAHDAQTVAAGVTTVFMPAVLTTRTWKLSCSPAVYGFVTTFRAADVLVAVRVAPSTDDCGSVSVAVV